MNLLRAARLLAWTIAAGAVAGLVVVYDSLPETIPLTRWNNVSKSLPMVLRVPLINLSTMALIELLLRSLHRVKDFHRVNAVGAVLLLTAGAKTAIEAVELAASLRLAPALFVVIFAGLGTAAFLGRELFQRERWRQLLMTPLETTAAAALAAGIVGLNLPLLSR